MSSFRTLACLAALAMCAACAPPAPVVIGCPAVKPWSTAEQSEMRRELDAMAADAILIAVMSDYVRMRDEARACFPAPKPNSIWPFTS
ncbi:MAG TPA: hypothetical protein VN980_15550 [Alphaproteobacteria bacterium]|nr:hypothetical protein [Alphaproteobacteria bacterium]